MGEKPLYYGWVGNQFVFASELKAIKKFPKFNNSIDRNALALFLRFNSIPSPHSIYEDIFKLEPGTIIQLNADSKKIVQSTYWSTEEEFVKSSFSSFAGTSEDAVIQLESVLSRAVSSQMESDVPLGAFLSGGVDSSLIVALMQSQSSKKINTFSIGFNNPAFNEAEHALLVSNHLGTNHSELYVNESDALDIIPNLPYIYDEPFADSSQIPTYIVSKFAKQDVSVSLSGDGGDEVFGGYNRYIYAQRMFGRVRKIPVSVKRTFSKAISSMSEEKLDKIFGAITRKSYSNIGDKLHKAASILSADSVHDSHFKLVSQIHNPENWLINSNEYKTKFNDDISRFKGLNSVEKMMGYDLITYLPTDILTKVDRAAMAVSLETRIPFLDPDVIKFSASLPINYKIKNGVSKWILRELLYKYVKKDLIERPKMGFAIPLAEWLRGPLQDWAESQLSEKRLSQEGFFNVDFVRTKWLEHLSNKKNWHHQLWNVLMFQSWLEKN
jgi:asparagine synthase (glutamine-hydrolysing)